MIKIPNRVLTFGDESHVDLHKKFADYFNHYRAVNFNAKKDYDKSVTFEEKGAKLHQAIEAEISKVAGVNSTVLSEAVWKSSPMYRFATFAVVNSLVDMVIPDVINDEYAQFAEVKNGAYGDSFVFDIKSSDLFTITKNGNARRHVTANKQFTGQTSLIPENRSITVSVDWYRVVSGKENLAEYAMKVALSFEAEIAKDIYTVLANTYNTVTANFKEAAFTQDAFRKLASRVAAANGGAKAIAYGTTVALGSVLPTSDYLKMGLGESYVNIGYLPVFLNTPLMAINQKINWTSADYDFAISDNEIFFISPGSQKLVKICFEGETLSVQDGQIANANMEQDITLQKRWKTGIITNAKHGVLHLS